MKIVVAEDDPVMLRTLEFILEKAGHEVIPTREGVSALATLCQQHDPVLAILDVQMPGMDGIKVCQRIRSAPFVIPPYLIILTVRGGTENIIRGLNAGADDYITKPFDTEELRARVQVGVRMLELQQNLAERVRDLEETLSRAQKLQGLLRKEIQTYEFGPFRFETLERRLLHNGQTVPLSARVFDLLLLLIQNSGHLIEKEEIMREVWPNSFVEDNNLTVSMSALRKALGEAHGEHLYIETVPKRGYRFVAKVREIDSGENAKPLD
jgi:DNA-binding response OmpR family regulator